MRPCLSPKDFQGANSIQSRELGRDGVIVKNGQRKTEE
jgi:hypothetical protein